MRKERELDIVGFKLLYIADKITKMCACIPLRLLNDKTNRV